MFKGGCQGEPSNLGGKRERWNKLGLGIACKTSLCHLVRSFKTNGSNLQDTNCTCTRSVNKECSGRPGTHLCTHCHWCCFCLPFPGRQVSSNLDKGGRHLDVSRTANERPRVGGFLQIWKQLSAQGNNTCTIEFAKLRRRCIVALCLVCIILEAHHETCLKRKCIIPERLCHYCSSWRSQGTECFDHSIWFWLQTWQPLSQTRRRDTCWVFKQSPLAKALKTPCECASPILNLICGQSKQRNALGCDIPSCRSQPWSSNLLRIPN